MKVFVAGATGVAGRRTVAALVKAGHEVTGIARNDDKALLLKGLGATPATVDLFDASSMAAAVAGHEAVVNLATHIPPMSKAMRIKAWAENGRIRSEGSRNLVDAALAGGVGVYVQESITFLYEDAGDRWIDEDQHLVVAPYVQSVLDAEAQARRFTDGGGRGVVLRFGMFYAPDAQHTLDAVRLARRRVASMVGRPEAYVSSVLGDDIATAVVAALEAPAGVYNVVDDEPLTRRAYCEALATALGEKPARFVPAALLKLGGSKVAILTRSQRVSNRRFKEATGWEPSARSAREGWPRVVAAMGEGEAA